MDQAIKGRGRALAACALSLGLFVASWPAQAGGEIFDLDFGKGEAQTLTVGDYTAIYLDEGSGPPIVLFHPSDDYRNWQRQIPELAKTHRVIALSYRIDENMFAPSPLAATLQALETKLELGPVDLVGHSFGGLQAMLLAAEHPELLRKLVRKLVLVEPAADLSAGTPHCALSDPSEFELGICNFESLVAGPGYYEGASEPFKQYLQELQRDEAKAQAAALESGRLKSLDALLQLPDVCSEASKITVPVLFIRGANTPAAFQVGLDHHEECLPEHERVVLPHATHWGHLDTPDEFNRAVLNFVDGN
jgi:pimeloyl-ACP methyl ester carboxylesterase